MHIIALFIGAFMTVLTILVIRERILMKQYSKPNTTDETLYEVSMAFGLIGAALAGVWLLLGFHPEALTGIVIIGLVALAAFTVLIGITMGACVNAGNKLRAEHKATKAEAARRAAGN
jgi:hypothetical protein